jgi:hypothetical protein
MWFQYQTIENFSVVSIRKFVGKNEKNFFLDEKKKKFVTLLKMFETICYTL